ncbi:MAG: MarR family transcriptional regulator [Planctomycetes bacterium]|nr:MarR family transcriptional regulator [Planctomycetota bacterium]
MARSSPTSRTADRLHSAAIHLLRRLRTVDVEAEVGPARLSALSVLVFGGERSLSELAATEQVATPTMSRLVGALETDGLVRRRPHPTDKRAMILSPTAKGRRLLERARARRLGSVESMLRGLDREELRVLGEASEILERVLRADRSDASR